MKKRKYTVIGILSVAALLTGVAACTDDTETIQPNSEGIFRFSAMESLYTRSTEAEETFDTGTKYQLYAISNNDWSTNLLSKEGSNDAVIGTENDVHIITYEGNNKFGGKTLDFYGVTASNESVLPLNTTGNTPTISVEYPSTGSLPDILWAQKPGQTYNQSGTIRLSFIHTLSKINFNVQKHTDVAGDLFITKIELCDYASGALDLSTGEFTSSSEVRSNNYYTVFEGKQLLSTDTKPLLDSKDERVEPTIFPTRSNSISDMSKHSLGIRVTLSKGKSYTYWTKEIALDSNNQPIKDKEGKIQYKPFQFKPNYEYDVQLTVTESAMVVTILPRVYDWIPDPEDQTGTEIGNPVTFGGVTWMDRNLGATSADPTASEMDWEKSRGFYYQFGRSIPFYVKGSIQDPQYENYTTLPSSCKTTTTCGSNSRNNPKPFPYVPFISGYQDLGQVKMSSGNSATKIPASEIAKQPKDKTLNYRFIYTQQDEGTTYRDWDWDHNTSAVQWNTQANQPCPKGWRLPTQDEFLTIYPSQAKYGDITFKYHPNATLYRESTSGEVYVGERATTRTTYGTIYAIKNKNTDNAYRLRWQAVNAKGNTDCRVLEISRYPASSTNDLNTSSNDANYYKKYDWDHPTEILRLPISGYVHADETNAVIIYSGIETIYWTSEANTSSSNTASSIRMKLGGTTDDKELKYWSLERRGYGCLIRCVRDNSVKD